MKVPAYYEPIYDKSNLLKFFKSDSGCINSHFHRCIEIHYMLSGSVTINVNGKEFIAEKDDIIFIPSFARHSLHTTGNYFSYVAIIGTEYSADFFDLFQEKTFDYLLSDKQFNASVLNIWTELHAMHKAYTTHPPIFLMKGLVNVIIGKLYSHYPIDNVCEKSNQENTVIEILDYINSHYKEKLSLQMLSNHFGYNKCYFSKLFNSFVKDGLNNYINMIRIQNILTEYKKSARPNLLNLVMENGFESLTTFYRNFEILYGKPPLEVLKKN